MLFTASPHQDERWRRAKPARFRGLKYKHGVPVIDDSHALRHTHAYASGGGGDEGKDGGSPGKWLLGASESCVSLASTNGNMGFFNAPEGNKLLCFHTFFKEAVHESGVETHRVRKCDIIFYLQDGSLSVKELKVENSGIPQGEFIKRQRVPKAGTDTFLGPLDMLPGEDVTMFDRVFHVVDCDGPTRAFLEAELGGAEQVPAGGTFPQDDYTVQRAEFMSRETGADPNVYRGILMNPTKMFVEAKLGKFICEPGALNKFMENNRKVLHFDGCWDDRGCEGGFLHRYGINFYLEDDTLEVCEVLQGDPDYCNGLEQFPKLLERGSIPSDYRDKDSRPVLYSDFVVGEKIMLYGRPIQILDADPFTRRYFASQGRPLGEAVVIEEGGKKKKPTHNVVLLPPHNGIGSEEDSMQSVRYLHPRPVKQDAEKRNFYGNKKLKFRAIFAEPLAPNSFRFWAVCALCSVRSAQ